MSWVGGTIYTIVQGRFGDDDIILSILELKLELETSGWWTVLLETAIARVHQSIVMKGKERQQKARFLYQVRALVVP